MTDASLTIDEILDAFKFNDGVYQREMVDAAIARREEIVPRMIETLQQVLADPDVYVENEDRMDHIYALMLLGHFRAEEAHGLIVDLFSISEEILDDLYGDIGTSNLPGILANTCGGSIDRMKAMALDREVGDYARVSALEGMAYAVIDNPDLRDEVVPLFGSLFTGEETDEDSDFWGLLAITICDLYPEENMAVIEKGFEEGLISPGMIGFEEFERTLQEGREATLDRLRSRREADALDDLHASMAWWACFESGEELFAPAGPNDLFSSDSYAPAMTAPKRPHQAEKQDRARKKKKRKQAKASKRKNRR